MEQVVHLGIGSNLGARRASIHAAVAALRGLAVPAQGLVLSSLWQSEALGFDEPAPAFVNAVARFRYDGSPQVLLADLQGIEAACGRERSGSEGGRLGYQSRTLDLDIIDFGGMQVSTGRLSLPHPRAQERLFVLLPLQEVSPGFRFPASDKSLAELIEAAEPMRISRLSP